MRHLITRPALRQGEKLASVSLENVQQQNFDMMSHGVGANLDEIADLLNDVGFVIENVIGLEPPVSPIASTFAGQIDGTGQGERNGQAPGHAPSRPIDKDFDGAGSRDRPQVVGGLGR